MIRILVDSSSDYTPEELGLKNIQMVPLTIHFGDETLRGGFDITANALYERLLQTDTFPTTSQPSPQDFVDCFQEAKDLGDEVICITLSSKVSGTYQSANIAKDMVEYEGIYVVDSKAGTHAIGILADHACKMRQEGCSSREIIAALEEIIPRIRIKAGVDSLEFLFRGGRIKRSTAIVGELANIKPMVALIKGELVVEGKCLGKNKAIANIVNELRTKKIDDRYPVYSIYAYGEENTCLLEKKLADIGIQCTERRQLGPVIGTHVGPGAFAVIYIEAEN